MRWLIAKPIKNQTLGDVQRSRPLQPTNRIAPDFQPSSACGRGRAERAVAPHQQPFCRKNKAPRPGHPSALWRGAAPLLQRLSRKRARGARTVQPCLKHYGNCHHTPARWTGLVARKCPASRIQWAVCADYTYCGPMRQMQARAHNAPLCVAVRHTSTHLPAGQVLWHENALQAASSGQFVQIHAFRP